MNIKKIASAALALGLALTLGACGKPVTYGQKVLDEAVGIRVDAENANADNTATTEGALVVAEGDVVIVSPFTEKGSFHLTITSADDDTVVYDEDVEGKIMFSIDVKPGTYDVTTSGNGVTGWMTVFAESGKDLADQNSELLEALKNDGVDTTELEEKLGN